MVGLLDNGKPNVVVIGAHMDHLGYGDEGSLHRGEPAIHNGADDNASGMAVMLQLARDLRQMDEARGNDYLFIAFSGEEKGLYGSNWWTKHPTLPHRELNYMINLDMVGRARHAPRPRHQWRGHFARPGSEVTSRMPRSAEASEGEDQRRAASDRAITPASTCKDVPAIHFFTGAHEDYHKPSDDEEKINYDGMLRDHALHREP